MFSNCIVPCVNILQCGRHRETAEYFNFINYNMRKIFLKATKPLNELRSLSFDGKFVKIERELSSIELGGIHWCEDLRWPRWRDAKTVVDPFRCSGFDSRL